MDENMLRMQQEAVERVRQMQERARQYVESEVSPNEDLKALGVREQAEQLHPEKERGLLLGGFGADSEQLLLLMLAVLLIKSNARMELVLALLYIAM